ncbi:hypothetical protein ACW9UR_22315 [Halovulum sp. GXIMD14794]
MDDFGPVVYLDVQKTGSTLVSEFLAAQLALPRKRFEKHGRVAEAPAPDVFHFITVREPLSQYLSLYQYGCSWRGWLFWRLLRAGRFRLYSGTPEGFERWLRFVMDPANAALLREGYAKAHPELIGFQSFRFLALSFARPMRVLRRQTDLAGLNAAYDRQRLHSAVLKTETLAEDLTALARGPLAPHLRDPEGAIDWLARGRRVNASKSRGIDASAALSAETRSWLFEREAFLYDRFYPDARK